MLSNQEIKVENIKIEVEIFKSEDFVGTNENDIFNSGKNDLLSPCFGNDVNEPPIKEYFQKVRRICIVTITIFHIPLKCVHAQFFFMH